MMKMTLGLMTFVVVGCGSPAIFDDAVSGTGGASGAGGMAGTGGGGMAGSTPPDAGPRCPATPVTCSDQSIQTLNLRAVVSDGGIREEGALTFVDARAGGTTTPQSYIYARFTAQGLQKVEIADEAALQSLDWDIAFRRFVIRLNSGVSGPSCVLAARTAPATTFAGLTTLPDNLSWRTESYFTGATCEFVADPSGIGGPNTALASYWTYQMCVQTTGNVYVLHLRDGRYVKLEVVDYYDPQPQMVCNMTGAVPMPNGAAQFRVRWAFL